MRKKRGLVRVGGEEHGGRKEDQSRKRRRLVRVGEKSEKGRTT